MTPVIIKTIQASLDYLFILLSFILAYFFRVGFILSTDFSFAAYFSVFLPTSVIWLVVLIFEKTYTTLPIAKRRLFTNIIKANLVGVTIFVLIFFYKRDIFFSRLILVYVWTISNILIISNAWLFRIIQFYLYKKGIWTKKTLIVGANRTAEKAIQNLQENEPFYQAVAILDAYGTKKKEISSVPVLGKMNSLEEIIKKKNISVILQSDCLEQSVNLVHLAEKNNLDYFLMPNLLGSYHENISVSVVGKQPMITLRNFKKN